MDAILGIIQNFFWVTVLVVMALVALIYIKTRYKVPSAGQALVITGGKKGMRVLPGGGAFVSPLRKHQFFPLKVMTVRSDGQETQTKTLVPVIVEWTAQLRADNETAGALVRAATGFADYDTETITKSLQQTLDGEVRAVVAMMTPEQVVQDKVSFSEQVKQGVEQRMGDLGFQLVSLNIATVDDNNGHYHNLAAADRETRRREAETLTAQANQAVAVEVAKSDEVAQSANLERDLNVAEKTREVTLRRAAIKAETDAANADADIAGQLQRELRSQELATREGQVAVVREQQRQAAATARRDVELTEAETAKQRDMITAESLARQSEIEAQAAAVVARAAAEGEAQANAARARGEAEAEVARAEGQAQAIAKTTEARTDEVRRTGLATAEVAQAQGEAEAAAILARGRAEAEAQRLMADALAANEGANLKVTLAEIDRDTTIRVYTTVGEAMARIGEHATFIDMGGSSNGGGDLLSSVLGNVPKLLKQLDVKSAALNNGAPFGDAVGSLIASLSGQSVADGLHPIEPVVRLQNEGAPSGAPLVDESVNDESATSDSSEGQAPGDSATAEHTER